MSYPTIYFYSKDKTIKPIKCEANTEAELVQWLKDHS